MWNWQKLPQPSSVAERLHLINQSCCWLLLKFVSQLFPSPPVPLMNIRHFAINQPVWRLAQNGDASRSMLGRLPLKKCTAAWRRCFDVCAWDLYRQPAQRGSSRTQASTQVGQALLSNGEKNKINALPSEHPRCSAPCSHTEAVGRV